MTQEIINTGSTPNDGGGDPLRAAFEKINNNFANLYALTGANAELAPLIDLTDQTSLQKSFNKINNNFANLFSLTANTPAVVEIIDPSKQTANQVQTGNVNNLNIGNVYITNKFDSRSNNPVIIRNKNATPTLTTTVPAGTLGIGPYNNQEYINIGASPNDGNGDPLRVAFGKINNNFSNLFFTSTTTATEFTIGSDANQVIYEVPVDRFYQGEFQIRSSQDGTRNMQDITLSASIKNNLGGVRFTGYATMFDGNAICRYDMDVSAGNVRVLVNPLADITIEHFISAYVTYPETVNVPGLELALDGYANGYVLGAENGLILTTEQP